MGVKASGLHLEVARIQSEINRLFEHLLELRDGAGALGTGSGWVPPVDVAEAADELIVEAEIPGVDPTSLSLFLQEGNLVVRGERPAGELRDSPGSTIVHDERGVGRFERVVPLGVAVNPHAAEATFSRGVLSIRLPRVPNRRGAAVAIAITTAEEPTR